MKTPLSGRSTGNDRSIRGRFAWLLRLKQPAYVAGMVGLSLTFTGCTGPCEWLRNGLKVGPNYKRPPAPVAEKWIDSDDKRVQSIPQDDSTWWRIFGDPVLDELVQSAYRQNLPLREAGYRVLRSRARLGEVIGEFFPQQQEATAGFERNSISQTIANRQFTPTKWFSIWAMGFNLAWELDFWGRFRRQIEAADADLNASIEDYDAVLVTLIGDVAQSYTQIRTTQLQLVYAKQNVALQRETVKLVQIRFENGAVSDLDVQQALSNLAQTESIIPPLEIQLREANNKLCILLGIPPEDLDKKLGAGGIPKPPIEAVVGIPADLMRRRPDVRRAERYMAGQSARIGVAESRLYPSIFLNGSIGVEASHLSDLYRPRSLVGSIGPSLSWEILNYGRNLNRIRIEDAQFNEFLVKYQNTLLTANQEVENGLISFLKFQAQMKFLEDAVKAAQKSVDLAIIQYKEGKVDFNRVFLLERDLVQQQNQLAASKGNITQGLISVYRALGGGWQLRGLGDLPPMPATTPPETTPPGTLPKLDTSKLMIP